MTSKKKGRRAQPARPPNSWICYRSDKVQMLKSTADVACLSQADLCMFFPFFSWLFPFPSARLPILISPSAAKLLGQMWRNESPEVREYYTHLAAEKKAAHREKYPGSLHSFSLAIAHC